MRDGYFANYGQWCDEAFGFRSLDENERPCDPAYACRRPKYHVGYHDCHAAQEQGYKHVAGDMAERARPTPEAR